MNQAYIAEINAHSLGDILGNMSWDIQAGRNGVELYWQVHYGLPRGGEVNHALKDGWLNVELFRLLDRAGIFPNRVHIPLIYSGNRQTESCLQASARYIEWVYGREVTLTDLGYHPNAGGLFPRVIPMPDEFRRRFAFLARGGWPERHATIQPTSSRYSDDSLVAEGRAKRITVGRALQHLRSLPARGIGRLYVLGCRRSAAINARFVERIRPELPGVEIIDRTGHGTLEDYFARLFGSVYHVGCESNSAFFTAQLGIESIQVYRPVSTGAFENFSNYFRDVPSLKLELDSADCLEGDVSDLWG